MPLEHSSPGPTLAAELDEVARDASDLIELLQRGLNAPLPDEFPREQLLDVCRSLATLPEGTAEGSRAPLEYSRNRLPAIRREHIPAEKAQHTGKPLLLVRGASLDQKLATLISSVGTALDAYRRLAAEESDNESRPEAGVAASSTSIIDIIKQSKVLGASLGTAQQTVSEISQPGSGRAENLKRQLQDARGLTQLTSAEARMPKVVVGWLRKTIDALKHYPELIRRSMSGLQLGADVAEIWVERWHEFQNNGIKFLFDEFRKTTKVGERTADMLEQQQKKVQETSRPSTPASLPIEAPVDETNAVAIAIKRKDELQSAVRATLDELDRIEEYSRMHRSVLPGSQSADALKIRNQGQSRLLSTMKELDHIDKYLAMHRKVTLAASSEQGSRFEFLDEPTLSRAGRGLAKRVFEHLALMVLRDVGRPMQSGEMVDAFQARGHALGGANATKTAWNRLWEAKSRGILEHHADLGYWIAGEPLSEEAMASAETAKVQRKKGIKRGRNLGRPVRTTRGRQRILSDDEVATARNWLLSGRSMDDVCADLGGISKPTLYNRIPGGLTELKKQYPHLVTASRLIKRPLRPQGSQGKGFKKLTSDEIARAKQMHKSGNPVRLIASEFDVSVGAIYRALRGRLCFALM